MKIAVVWNYPSRLLDCSFRFEQYLKGLRELGHEAFIVCTRLSAEGGFPGEELQVVERFVDFEEVDFWRKLGADAALITTWLRMSDVLAAIRAAGTKTVAITDSDGQIGLHVYPRIGFERLMAYQKGFGPRMKGFRYWFGRVLRERLTGRPEEDLEALESARQSDVLSFCHTGGREKFRAFLEHYGEEKLLDRTIVVPFTNGDAFLACPVPEAKAERIVAIGRWDDPQKNTRLLAGALDRYLEERPTTEVILFGGGGERRFASLAERHPSLEWRGVAHQEEVARTLAGARVWLGTSRWETGPMAATEALALGATIVGPPIPSYTSYSEAHGPGEGPFGRVARRAHPDDLARALLDEMSAWDRGERDGLSISAHWRTLLDPAELCRRLLEPLATL